MKFDYIIGNPPYQDETIGDNDTYAPPVYNKFMDASYKIGSRVELITPARFLFNAGRTPKDWNKKMLNDQHFKVLYYNAKSNDIFSNTDIKGGISITYRDNTKTFEKIETFTSYSELNTISQKVKQYLRNGNITAVMYNQTNFNLDEVFKDFPELKKPKSKIVKGKKKEVYAIGSEGRDRRLEKNIFIKIPDFTTKKVFTDEPISKKDIKVLGVISNKRVWKYILPKYIDCTHDNLYTYKVIVPRSNGSGALGEVLSTPLIGEPLIGYTRTFISIGSYSNKDEAENTLKYIKSKFARTMLGVLKITQDNPIDTWRLVPLQDFTSNSDIDWSQSIHDIDLQLYKKYGLDEKEIDFIETHVKEMD